MVKEFEIVKRDAIIKIDVSAVAYFSIKEHCLKLLEKYNTNELLAKIVDESGTLEEEEYSIKVFLDLIAEVEKTAIANKQTEVVSIKVTGIPDEESTDPS